MLYDVIKQVSFKMQKQLDLENFKVKYLKWTWPFFLSFEAQFVRYIVNSKKSKNIVNDCDFSWQEIENNNNLETITEIVELTKMYGVMILETAVYCIIFRIYLFRIFSWNTIINFKGVNLAIKLCFTIILPQIK